MKSKFVANNLEEPHEKGDFYFVFEAALNTHLTVEVEAGTTDTEMIERHDKQKEKLKTMNHEQGT